MTLKALIQQDEEPNAQVAVDERTKSFLMLPQVRQEIILAAAIEYEMLNRQGKILEARKDRHYRPIVEGAADAYGIEDQNEHVHLIMEKEGVSVEVIRTKKTSCTINSVAAEEILKDAGLYDSCVTQVISWEIDEEKVIDAYNAGLLSASDVDKMFNKKISWATSVKSNLPELESLNKIRKEIEKSNKAGLPEITSE